MVRRNATAISRKTYLQLTIHSDNFPLTHELKTPQSHHSLTQPLSHETLESNNNPPKSSIPFLLPHSWPEGCGGSGDLSDGSRRWPSIQGSQQETAVLEKWRTTELARWKLSDRSDVEERCGGSTSTPAATTTKIRIEWASDEIRDGSKFTVQVERFLPGLSQRTCRRSGNSCRRISFSTSWKHQTCFTAILEFVILGFTDRIRHPIFSISNSRIHVYMACFNSHVFN